MMTHTSHILSEGNSCADKHAKYGIRTKCNTWWDNTLSFAVPNVFRDRFW